METRTAYRLLYDDGTAWIQQEVTEDKDRLDAQIAADPDNFERYRIMARTITFGDWEDVR